MNFADDERARVPFALVGVVLLVTSATAAATLAAHDPAPDRTRGDRAADRVETGADVALASATRAALSAAAHDPVVASAETRYGAAIDSERAFRESLSLRVYARTERALRTVDATAGDVTASASLQRVQTTADAENALSEAGAVTAERAARRLGAADVGSVPAGLPLAPVPGFWYATTNAWSVSIRGEWSRFAVHAAGGSPVGPGNGAAYVREREPVAFDVNGDGRPDRVGRNERLTFDVDATIGVVVPAGPRGVGDVGGDADERSAGW